MLLSAKDATAPITLVPQSQDRTTWRTTRSALTRPEAAKEGNKLNTWASHRANQEHCRLDQRIGLQRLRLTTSSPKNGGPAPRTSGSQSFWPVVAADVCAGSKEGGVHPSPEATRDPVRTTFIKMSSDVFNFKVRAISVECFTASNDATEGSSNIDFSSNAFFTRRTCCCSRRSIISLPN